MGEHAYLIKSITGNTREGPVFFTNSAALDILGRMGGILSLTSLACCFTSTACTAGCALCPSCKNSTGARIMYGLLLLVTLVISCIMLAPGLQDVLSKVNWISPG